MPSQKNGGVANRFVTPHGTLSLLARDVHNDGVLETEYKVRFKDKSKAGTAGLTPEQIKEGHRVSDGKETISTYYRGTDELIAKRVFSDLVHRLKVGKIPTKQEFKRKNVRHILPKGTDNRTDIVRLTLPIPVDTSVPHKVRVSPMRKGMDKKSKRGYFDAQKEISVISSNPLVAKKLTFSTR